MRKGTAVARFTGNHQVSIPKAVREAVGLPLSDFVELTAERGTIVMRPKELKDKAIPAVSATPAERRAIKRGRAEVASGDAIPYEHYQADRRRRRERQRHQKRTKAAR